MTYATVLFMIMTSSYFQYGDLTVSSLCLRFDSSIQQNCWNYLKAKQCRKSLISPRLPTLTLFKRSNSLRVTIQFSFFLHINIQLECWTFHTVLSVFLFNLAVFKCSAKCFPFLKSAFCYWLERNCTKFAFPSIPNGWTLFIHLQEIFVIMSAHAVKVPVCKIFGNCCLFFQSCFQALFWTRKVEVSETILNSFCKIMTQKTITGTFLADNQYKENRLCFTGITVEKLSVFF